MKKYLAAVLVAMSCCVLSNVDATTTPEREATQGVDLQAGITSAQADAIAAYYFHAHIAGCGAADPAVDKNSSWEVTPRLGLAGVPAGHPIIIEKHTGRIAWKGGPTLDVASMMASERRGLPQPIKRQPVTWPKGLPAGAHRMVAQIEFTVMPSGATSDLKIKHSTAQRQCDSAAMEAVSRWRYAPRNESIRLVEDVETCTY